MGFFDDENGSYVEDFMGMDWDEADGPLWVDVTVNGDGVELKVLDDGAVAFHGLCQLGWTGRFTVRRELVIRASDGALVEYAMADGYQATVGEARGAPYSLRIAK
ncbi:MAG TPA: hypothetical protein VGE07_16580 [Herpetosiphonaceae bacterium]